MVGFVVSRVIVTVEVTAEVGPTAEFESRTAEFALNRGITVPSLEPLKQDEAVRV
jgi:hypothetical protein